MTLTTPAQERYTRFSCPNPHCARFNRPGEGNIAHRSWTGTHKHIERLRCTACDREFSEREGTLMARSKLPEDTVIRLVKCQRWGVCDEGTADICAVDLKTVHRFQRVAAQRAETHHRQSVQHVEVQGVQLDEAHSKLRPKQVEWVHTALAMGSWFLLWVDFGPRTQDTAATLIAQVVARTQAAPALSHGWVEGLYGGVASGRGGRVSSPAAWESGPQAEAPAGGAARPCSTPRWSRSATRLAMSWRSAGAWSSVAHAVLASSCACGSSARRSRRPSWNAGMAPCVGWSRPCGAAPGVCPGAARATGGRSGSWSASTTL